MCERVIKNLSQQQNRSIEKTARSIRLDQEAVDRIMATGVPQASAELIVRPKVSGRRRIFKSEY